MTNTNQNRRPVTVTMTVMASLETMVSPQMMLPYRVRLPEIAAAVSTDTTLQNHGMHDVIDGEVKAVIDAKVHRYAIVGTTHSSTIGQCKSLKSHLFRI